MRINLNDLSCSLPKIIMEELHPSKSRWTVHSISENDSTSYFSVIKRIMSLISRSAQLEAASEAALKQAESATKTAKTLMNAVSSFPVNVFPSTILF